MALNVRIVPAAGGPNIVRIVPAAGGPNCRGTRVFVGENEIAATRIELVADLDGAWKARIDVLADIDGAIFAELANDGA